MAMLPSCYDKNGNIIDFYTIFNISNTAEPGEIKSAFRTLIKRYHPDTATIKADNITEKLALIIRGYRILIDDDLRIEYDRLLFSNRKIDSRGYAIISKKRDKDSGTLRE